MRTSELATPGGHPRRLLLTLVLYTPCALALAFTDFYIRRNPGYVVSTFVPGVLHGTYEAPFIYRPLAAWIVAGAIAVTGLPPLLVFLALRTTAIYASLLSLHWYLRTWYPWTTSLGATLAASALLPLTFTNSWQVPGTFVELTLFTVGCGAIARDQRSRLYPLLLVATLNRETSVFLVILWVAYHGKKALSGRTALHTAGYGVTWLAVYVGVRWYWGLRHYEYVTIWKNLRLLNPIAVDVDARLRVMAYLWVVLLVIPGALAIAGARARDAPPMFRASVRVAGLYLATTMIFAALIETRIFMPMFPLLLPCCVLALTVLAQKRS